MSEAFTPIAVASPSSFSGRVLWYLRLASDLQLVSIVRDLEGWLGQIGSGQTGSERILDIGCGNMPFRHRVERRFPSAVYVGFDVAESARFGFTEKRATPFDGLHLPVEAGSADSAICTEVLEHHPAPEALIAEIHRVLRPGGSLFATIPWSARVHFSPHDYGRYTPYQLKKLFVAFPQVRITPRGTDVASICAKVVVVFLRCCQGGARLSLRGLLGAVLLAPCMPLVVLLGQLAIRFRLGSVDDPLGYTVVAGK
ncbi:MAG: class I SAM-dependent methyltransferase [Oligoflexia bacterium]|nr:class I SAM-dependent methyltransferase [Oligoflexia bacterium]